MCESALTPSGGAKTEEVIHYRILIYILILLVFMLLIIKIIFFPLMLFFILLLIIKKFTPRINQNNINYVGKQCIKLFQLEDLNIIFKLDKSIDFSHVRVINKKKKYIVFVKDNWLGYHASEIIHELTHIKTGQSDMAKDLPNNFKSLLLNIYFDLFSAWPNEIRYFFWVRNNCIDINN